MLSYAENELSVLLNPFETDPLPPRRALVTTSQLNACAVRTGPEDGPFWRAMSACVLDLTSGRRAEFQF